MKSPKFTDDTEPWDNNANQMGTRRSGALLRSEAQRKAPQGWIIKLALINIPNICNVLFCSLVNLLM